MFLITRPLNYPWDDAKLIVDVWDFDESETFKEKLEGIGKVKKINGIAKWFTELKKKESFESIGQCTIAIKVKDKMDNSISRIIYN